MSGPIPKFCDPRGGCGICTPRVRVSQAAPGTYKRRRVAAQGAGRRPRVRSCSPCPSVPDARLSSRSKRGLRAAAHSWTRPGRPRPTARFPAGAPAHSPQLTGAVPWLRDGDGHRRTTGCSALRFPSSRRLDELPPSSRSAQTEAPAAELQKAGWARGQPSE